MVAAVISFVSTPRYSTRSTRLLFSGDPFGLVVISTRLFIVSSRSSRSSRHHNIDHQDARLTRLGVVKRTRVPCGIAAPLVWRVGSVQWVKWPSLIPSLLVSVRPSFAMKVRRIDSFVGFCRVVCVASVKDIVLFQIVSFDIVVEPLLNHKWSKNCHDGVRTNTDDLSPDCPWLILFVPVMTLGLVPLASARCFITVSEVRFLMACWALVDATPAMTIALATKLLSLLMGYDIVYKTTIHCLDYITFFVKCKRKWRESYW